MTTPPLTNIISSPYTSNINGDPYRYNGVFGAPSGGIGIGNGGLGSPVSSTSGQGPAQQGQREVQGWAGDNKRGSRSGIPVNWYDPPSRDSTPYDPYRRDHSPPALSPPSSTTSPPTSHNPYAYHHHNPYESYPPNMAVTPSSPPLSTYANGLPTAGSAPNLANYPPGGLGNISMNMSNLSLSMGMGMGMPMNMSNGGLPTYGSQSLQSISSTRSNPWSNPLPTSYAPQLPLPSYNNPDDIIPTAIVIKNIPFSITRDHLLSIISSLSAPLPYAFNYHHDQGVFRGLAFANFRAPEEAQAVVAALNGYDVQGRKLRVEYKKVLQPGEKDKIEREKALKRMRSIQFESSIGMGLNSLASRERDLGLMPPPPVPPLHLSSRNSQGLTLNPILSNSSSSLNILPNPNLTPDQNQYDQPASSSPPHSATSTTHSDSQSMQNLPDTLDLNDPTALDIYSRVLVFKEDRMRDDLAFSKNLTPTERRIVHLVAGKLGLKSSTQGEGEGKFAVVTREVKGGGLVSSTSTSGSGVGIERPNGYLSPYATPTDTATSPGGLRVKKSMPDLRGFGGAVVGRDPNGRLTPQRSSGNLREGFDTAGGGGQGREYVSMGAVGGRKFGGGWGGSGGGGDVPPVPALPVGYGGGVGGGHGHSQSRGSFSGINGNGNGLGTSPESEIGTGGAATQVMRNPRGPAGDTRGFGGGLRGSASVGGGLRSLGRSLGGGGGGGMGLGRRVSEEDEDYDDLGIGSGVGEGARTRESLDL